MKAKWKKRKKNLITQEFFLWNAFAINQHNLQNTTCHLSMICLTKLEKKIEEDLKGLIEIGSCDLVSWNTYVVMG